MYWLEDTIMLMMSVFSVLIYRFDTIIRKIQEDVSCRHLQANSKIDVEKTKDVEWSKWYWRRTEYEEYEDLQ